MNPRILVAYYTRSGHTKKLAESIATSLGADREQITDRVDRSGLLGYLRSGFEGSFERLVEIDPGVHDPKTYDLVIVGTPISECLGREPRSRVPATPPWQHARGGVLL